MRRSKTLTLAEVIRDYTKEMKIDGKLREVALVGSWEKIVGRAVASRTTRIYVKDGTLFVHLKSSVIKSELLMMKENLRLRLNEEAGSEIISDIVFR
jgi:predicted nucleic acid-binding Zn ribbon protein